MIENGLSARESFIEALEAVRQKLNGIDLALSPAPRAEIVNYSDWHRTKVGYSAYGQVVLATINGKEWALALGIACGDDPADRYNCDIAAIPVDSNEKSGSQVFEEIYEALKGGERFKNSVVVAMGDGQLVLTPKEPFRRELLKAMGAGVPKEFTARKPEYQESVIHGGCRPVVSSPKRYTDEFPSYLSDIICEALVACS